MHPARARLCVEEEGRVYIVTFNVMRIVDQMVIREIQAEFDVLVGEVGAREVLIDFDGVEALSSSAIGVLVSLHERLEALGGRLKLAGVSDDVAHILSLTRLDRMLSIHDDRDAALAAF